MNFKNRMYTMYDNPLDEGASKLYLSNGYDNMTSQEVKDENSIIEDLEKWNHKFLTFGGVDYYIFDNPDTALLQVSDSISYSEEMYMMLMNILYIHMMRIHQKYLVYRRT